MTHEFREAGIAADGLPYVVCSKCGELPGTVDGVPTECGEPVRVALVWMATELYRNDRSHLHLLQKYVDAAATAIEDLIDKRLRLRAEVESGRGTVNVQNPASKSLDTIEQAKEQLRKEAADGEDN
jgi:hypothetical protein